MILYSVLRGVRSPNLWAATQLLFNYDFGFVKRGLAGTLVAQANLPVLYTYHLFFWASFALLAVNLLLLLVLCVRATRRSPWPLPCAILVYFSSMGIVYLVHTVGYFDHLALLVVLAALAIRAFWPRLVFIALFFSLSLFVHEGGFVIFGPLLVLVLVLDVPPAQRGAKMGCVLVLAAATSAETLLAGSATLGHATVDAMYAALQVHADYPLRRDAFDVLTRGLSTNMAITASKWHEPFFVNANLASIPVVLPSIAFMLWITRSTLRAQGRSGALSVLAYVASLSPLALHLFGWDGVRWNTLAITTSFLVTLAVSSAGTGHGSVAETAPVIALRRHPFLLPTCVFLVLFNLGTSVTLFDGFAVQSFPFRDHVTYLRDVQAGKAAFPVLPEQ